MATRCFSWEANPLSRMIGDWRLGAIAFAVLVSSQGCGIIADTPERALSTRQVPPPESRPAPPSVEKAPRPSGEISPTAKIPLPPLTRPAPEIETPPAPLQPTLTETGLASWYGPRFHGKLTASGEVFNQEQLTAAHPSLPWGTKVKVINLDNGKFVDVRINDRGPFKRGRIIDLSKAAARALDMVSRGIAKVRLEWLSDSEKTNDFALQGK